MSVDRSRSQVDLVESAWFPLVFPYPQLENIIGLKLMQHGGDPTRPFLLYDTEGLGKLTPNDFRRAINGVRAVYAYFPCVYLFMCVTMPCQMGVRLTDGELRSLMSRYDSDGDGLLNYVDFAALATGATVWSRMTARVLVCLCAMRLHLSLVHCAGSSLGHRVWRRVYGTVG